MRGRTTLSSVFGTQAFPARSWIAGRYYVRMYIWNTFSQKELTWAPHGAPLGYHLETTWLPIGYQFRYKTHPPTFALLLDLHQNNQKWLHHASIFHQFIITVICSHRPHHARRHRPSQQQLPPCTALPQMLAALTIHGNDGIATSLCPLPWAQW